MGTREWNKRNRKYHREWMRRWRENEENRLHEQALVELREAVREGIVRFEVYMNEIRHPWKVRFQP